MAPSCRSSAPCTNKPICNTSHTILDWCVFCAQAVLRLAGKWVRSYVQAVTGSVAQGIEAAGIQVALPREVGTLLAFLRELGRFGDVPDSLVARHIPFVYDTWLSVFE